MLRLVAPVTDHLSVAILPLVIQVGLAAKLLITGGDPEGGGLEPPLQLDIPSARRMIGNTLARDSAGTHPGCPDCFPRSFCFSECFCLGETLGTEQTEYPSGLLTILPRLHGLNSRPVHDRCYRLWFFGLPLPGNSFCHLDHDFGGIGRADARIGHPVHESRYPVLDCSDC